MRYGADRFFIAVIAVAVWTLNAVDVAHAAEYEVWSCRGPDGSPISTVAWERSEEQAAPGDVQFSDSCDTGGPLDVSVGDLSINLGRSALGRYSFRPPSGAVITGYELWRYLKVDPGSPVSLYRTGMSEESPLSTNTVSCERILPGPGCSEEGDPIDPYDPGNYFAGSGLELIRLSLWAQCGTTTCLPAISAPAALFRLYRSKVTVDDRVAPSAPLLSGSILEPGNLRGKVNLLVEAADVGSGIRRFALSVDDGPETTLLPRDPSGACLEPYDRPQPCPLQAARLFVLDTDQLSEGHHLASGRVIDAAGNETTFGPIPFQVERGYGSGGTGGQGGPGGSGDPGSGGGDGPIVATNGNPAVIFPRIELARRSISHRPHVRGQVRGRILTASGRPVVGAELKVEVETNGLRGSRRRALADVRSGPDGSFRIPVPGTGHRTVTVSYSPAAGLPATRSSRADVLSTLQIQLRRRPARLRPGNRFVLLGRLLGGGETVSGANVEIQSIVSRKWRTVANVSARRGGRFVWRYRFRYVNRDAIFPFRAVVRRTPGWPWKTLRSRAVTVRIDAT